jgi:hypothetical protein
MKMHCTKPCSEKAHCSHYAPHKQTSECKSGCDNGAKCVPVDAVQSLTADRGAVYGHPLDHFPVTRKMSDTWIDARMWAINKTPDRGVGLDHRQEQAIRHAVYMICDKLARLATSPTHEDSWRDIQGYARTALMVLGVEK